MPLLKIYTLLVCCALSFGAMAQYSDSTPHFIHVSSTGVINRTDESKSFLLSNVIKYGIKRKNIVLNSNTSFIYGKQQDQLSNRDFNSNLDFNYYPYKPSFYFWGLLNFDRSYSLSINHRLQAGSGVAYNIFNSKEFELNLSDGVLYETSDLVLKDSSNLKDQIFRNSLRLRYNLVIKEIIVLHGSNFIQNSLTDGRDYILQSVNTLGIKLRKWLTLNAAITYNRIQKTHKENLLLTFGITAEKYF